MKPYKRRQAGAYPYYRLSVWDILFCCWRDNKKAYITKANAKTKAVQPGQYCINQIDKNGVCLSLEKFEIK